MEVKFRIVEPKKAAQSNATYARPVANGGKLAFFGKKVIVEKKKEV